MREKNLRWGKGVGVGVTKMLEMGLIEWQTQIKYEVEIFLGVFFYWKPLKMYLYIYLHDMAISGSR